MTDLTTVKQEPRRDRWGRPLVVPPSGGKPVPYTRATTVAGTLDDLYGLMAWKQRQTAVGLADRPDLQLAVTAHRDDKRRLDDICEQALEAAKSSASATTGTALHTLTEYVDTGRDLPTIPPDAQADLDAYRRAMEPFEIVAIEQFCVIDDHQIGGTPDRIVRWDGLNLIADLKTGQSLDYSWQKIAAQLAIYARSVGYDIDNATRFDLPDIYPNAGLVVHVPSGSGQAQVHWIDLKRGWRAVELALEVREWRKTRDLSRPFRPASSSEVA